MKKNIIASILIISGFILFTGQDYQPDPRWSQDPRTSVMVPQGDYIPLPGPTSEYIHPNTETKIVQTRIGAFAITPNLRVHPTSGNSQTETIIVRHPLNPNIMFGSSNAVHNSNAFISEGVYVTTNGGLSWFGSDTVNAPSLVDQRGDPGPTIDKNGRFILTHLTSASVFGGVTGIGANYSVNNGVTWAATFQISSNGGDDKNLAGTDDAPASAYYGNSYVAWTRLSGVTGNGWFSRTTNGGVSWVAPIQINTTPVNHFAQGHDVKVGPNGEVYVCWTAGSSTFPYTEDFVGFAKSVNGGVSFTVTENAYDVNGSRSFSFGGWGIRTNGFPRLDVDKSGSPRNGWIYIVTSELNLSPAGTDADIVLHRSTNGGTTWSAGIRVNQDALNNGKVQWFPVVKVDQTGGVNVLYYDNRNFPAGDSCAVFLSRSIDGGNTWVDFEVTDHHFKPKAVPGFGNYMGDYIGLTAVNNQLWPLWMDDKSGVFQAWTTKIDMLPDLWSKDRPFDTGVEPNPDVGPMWISEDIWVRNQQDGFTNLHQHQNPEYRDSILYPYSPNYVYVMVRNRGGAPGSGKLKTYWAKASTGLNWPTQWVNYYQSGILHGNLIHSNQPIITNLAAGDSIVFEIPWFPPNPSDFSIFGSDSAHFCLLARIETTPSTPFGMTYPEGAGIFTNVKNNNNIVWKNVTIVDNFAGGGLASSPLVKNGWVVIRNVEAETMQMQLSFDIPRDEHPDPFQNYGTIMIDLGDKLFARWVEGGMEGDGIEVKDNLINVVKVDAYISGIKLDAEEQFTLKSIFTLNDPSVKRIFNFDISQILYNEKRKDITGGERFILDTRMSLKKNTSHQSVKGFSISAYPNPFNPVTTISYSLPVSQKVMIKVYDVTGREVATLVDDVKPAGKHSVKFDGTDLSSGIYFYRIEAGLFRDTKKIILIK
jgi:hypothetical protein